MGVIPLSIAAMENLIQMKPSMILNNGLERGFFGRINPILSMWIRLSE